MKAPFFSVIKCFLIMVFSANAIAEKYDVVINNGSVIDGAGTGIRQVNIGVKDGEIHYIGKNKGLKAKSVIDASGLIVAPGFIDVHNHSEKLMERGGDLYNESFIRQGVTTIIVGPDGFIAPNHIKGIQNYIKQKGSSTHVAAYVGHNAIRKQVMGSQKTLANAEQLDEMRALVREGMKLGAVGLSTGLMYDPGMFSNTFEVVELAKEVKPFGGTYDSHVRNPVFNLIESYKEAIEISEKSGVPAKIAHAKIVGLHNQGLFKALRATINSARSKGLEIVTDQYPYDGAYNEDLWKIISIPHALQPKDQDVDRQWLISLLGDTNRRQELREYNEKGIKGFSWIKAVGYTSMRVIVSEQKPDLIGKHISEIARTRNQAEFDVISDLILDTNLDVNVTLGSTAESDVQNIMIQPWNMISSDGVWGGEGLGLNHPRSTGTYPKILGHYVRELGILDLENAIYKMSTFPANFIGFGQRGEVKEGFVADLVIFDPNTVRARSDWGHPEHYSEGMVHVLVGGELVLSNGRMTGSLPGKFVSLNRKTGHTSSQE